VSNRKKMAYFTAAGMLVMTLVVMFVAAVRAPHDASSLIEVRAQPAAIHRSVHHATAATTSTTARPVIARTVAPISIAPTTNATGSSPWSAGQAPGGSVSGSP